MLDELIYKALGLPLSLANSCDEYNDFLILNSEKMMNYSVSLVIEIDELLEKGYHKEEIQEIIMECDFVKTDPELANEEAEYLKKYALRLLNIRYKLFTDEKALPIKEEQEYVKSLKNNNNKK